MAAYFRPKAAEKTDFKNIFQLGELNIKLISPFSSCINFVPNKF
jgi:hypothetical protein